MTDFDTYRGIAVLVLFLGAVYIVYVIWTYAGGRPHMYCTTCHHRGQVRSRVNGSLLVELILWLCALFPVALLRQLPISTAVVMIYGVLAYSFVPALVYSAWRRSTRHRVCGLCGYAPVVPLDAPVAVVTQLVAQPRQAALAVDDPILDAVSRQRPD